MSIRTLIADDEPLARDGLRIALASYEDLVVVAECADGREAVEAIQRERPDLVFLDVRMPEMDGFDVVAHIGVERMPPVVFVTAYDEHAIQAFEIHAIDYVLKPVSEQRLDDVVRHARRRLGGGTDHAAALRAALEQLGLAVTGPGGADRKLPPATRVMVRTENGMRFLSTAAVWWIDAAGNDVIFHTETDTFQIRSTLHALLDRLDPARFVRIHRSTVVNIDHVREVQPWFSGTHVVILPDGRQLRVSRGYRDELLRLFR